MESNKRKDLMKNMNKWDEFRVYRQQAINNFVDAKRRYTVAKRFRKLLLCIRTYKRQYQGVKAFIQETINCLRRQYGAFKISRHFIRSLQKQFGKVTYEKRNQQRIRFMLTHNS